MFLSKFDVLLKRGTELPFKVVKEYCTVRDYQTKTLLNIYRGERPFVKYCKKVGVLAVQNLPKRKAGQVNIKVGFSVDENETLKIEAKHLSHDANGNVSESELYEMQIDRVEAESKVTETEGTMILESQKFKDDDAKTLKCTDKISRLIDSIRQTSSSLPNEREILDSINQIIDDINRNEEKLDDEAFHNFIERLLAIEELINPKFEPLDNHAAAIGIEPTKDDITEESHKVSKSSEAVESLILPHPIVIYPTINTMATDTNPSATIFSEESVQSTLPVISKQETEEAALAKEETKENLSTDPETNDQLNTPALNIRTAPSRDETAASTFFRF